MTANDAVAAVRLPAPAQDRSATISLRGAFTAVLMFARDVAPPAAELQPPASVEAEAVAAAKAAEAARAEAEAAVAKAAKAKAAKAVAKAAKAAEEAAAARAAEEAKAKVSADDPVSVYEPPEGFDELAFLVTNWPGWDFRSARVAAFRKQVRAGAALSQARRKPTHTRSRPPYPPLVMACGRLSSSTVASDAPSQTSTREGCA